ncbi:MAG TPA: hypothetical protein VGM81_08215 [Burkholderiaceae bacterium]|jgi:hypothetical protein
MSTTPTSSAREAVAALLQWQRDHLNEPQPPGDDETALRASLQAFAAGRDWSPKQLGWWEHSVKVLCANALAQPQIATQSGQQGSPLDDLARLLRGPDQAFEEAEELDLAIRWWEQARKAGLPLGEDFGELWQQFEWIALLQHLRALGRNVDRSAERSSEYSADQPLLWAHAIKVATRYIQLSPLAALLQEIQGGLTETGFTLR